MVKKNKRQRVNLPPELPPELPESEIELTEEDLEYVKTNPEAADFLSTLDTAAITSHVTRVANANGRTPEELFEERERRKKKRSSLEEGNRESGLQDDIVDALPVKTLDGRLQFRTMEKKMDKAESMNEEEAEGIESNNSVVKMSKAEKRAKMKKMRKEAKKQGKPEEVKVEEEMKQSSQAEVLAEVQMELTAEEEKRNKQTKLAELGMGLLADPEKNIKCLKEMLEIAKDTDQSIVKLAMLSLLAVFKDIIPGYRIRLPTEKEMEMTVSKAVKKMRYYESTLLSSYKAYLQKLILLEQQPSFQQVAVRCVCTLLDAVTHFNFRDSLLAVVVRNIGSQDSVIRKLCCETVKSLFINEGKHGGEATVEAVQLIANLVKAHNCQLHPDSIEVFLCLSFDEDLGKPEPKDGNRVKYKKSRRKPKPSELKKQKEDDKKRSRKELMEKTQQEVEADFKAVSFSPDVLERRNMQTETLSAVFETYFRILKHTMQLITDRSEATTSLSAGTHPLLDPCLNGLGKFSHLIDLDYMSDLLKYLKNLASGGSNGPSANSTRSLTVSERLRCCIVAFKVMRSNLDALNVDLQDFSVQLYNLILEYRPGRDRGDVLAEALKIMLCDDRQHDMLKAAAFIKRLATFSLCFGCAESMAALVTLKHLLQKNVKCRNLLENDDGGGSVSGSVAKYHPYATDPNLSGALASVLWELDLLSKHYNPSVSTLASSIAAMGSDNNQVYLNAISPQQAYKNLLIEQESFNMNSHMKMNLKRKRGSKSSKAVLLASDAAVFSFDEDEIRKKLSEHFAVFQVDIDKNDEQNRKPKKKKKVREVEADN